MNVLRLDVGGFAKKRHGIEEVFHRPQGLPTQEQDVGLQSARMIDAVECFQDTAGELIASVGAARHLVTKHGDQVEIAFGLSQDLLSADATGIRHIRFLPTKE